MKWKTAISTHKNGELYLHGERLTKLIGKLSFGEAIFFTLRGKRPAKRQSAMLDAVLVSMIEHGVGTPSTFVARTVGSTGNPINSALATGILTIGDWHGGAIEKAMFTLQSKETPHDIVKHAIANKERLSGF